MIRTFLKVAACIGLGALATQINWSSMRDWWDKPSIGEFETLFVTDFNTAYTAEEFVELGGTYDENGAIQTGTAVCPTTGATKFTRVIARMQKNFWGKVVGYDLAEQYQKKLKIQEAKGDMNWNEFMKAALEAKKDEEGAKPEPSDSKAPTATP